MQCRTLKRRAQAGQLGYVPGPVKTYSTSTVHAPIIQRIRLPAVNLCQNDTPSAPPVWFSIWSCVQLVSGNRKANRGNTKESFS